MISQPIMTLFLDGQEIGKYQSVVDAMAAALDNGPGTYALSALNAEIVIPERFPWQGEITHKPEPTPEPEPEIVEPEPEIVEPEPTPEPEIVEPEPEPEPAPEPEPTPEPVEKPKTDTVIVDPNDPDRPASIHKRTNSSSLLNFNEWNDSSRYTRAKRLVVWGDDTAKISFDCQDLSTTGGGGRNFFEGVEYTLYIDGEPFTTTTISAESRVGEFNVDVTKLSSGWHVLDLSEFGQETSVPYPVFVIRNGELPEQKWMPVFTGSHEIDGYYNLIWVPAVHAPREWPTPARTFPHFSKIPGDNEVFLEMLSGGITGHADRLNIDKHGVLSAFTKQDYFWSDFIAKKPIVELLDGPRGDNVLTMLTHITIGLGRQEDKPDSPLLNNIYVTTPWSFCRVSPNGNVTTLVGYRHKRPPSYWEDDPEVELIGDWSAIPEDRRGCHELWGQCWYPETLKVDHTASPIPEENNRVPHIVGPVNFLTDSQNNRVLRVEFNATAHGIPPKVTEFITEPDCWDCVSWGNHLIVSERGNHRIAQYNMATEELERVIVQGAPLAEVNRDRFVQRLAPIEELRAEDVVAPEGLYVWGDWLYYGSVAQNQVRRVHLIDGRIEVIVSYVTNRKQYLKIAVSDGTTGPEGTVFVSAWDVGAPDVFTPSGNKWSLVPYRRGGPDRGRGGRSGTYGFSDTSYSSAVACGNGRVIFGSAMEGVRQISWALPSDPDVDRSLFAAGQQQWRQKGYYLSHGAHGESFFGLPLPWGESPEIDYYLETMGH